MAMKQSTRSLRISTPWGEDKVQVVAFSGVEEMSRLFEFHLDLISEDNALQAQDIVGKNVTFSIDLDDGTPRLFNGFVKRFGVGDENVKGIRGYRMVLVPWLWFLTQTTDCRIFQDMTVLDIIEKIFQDLGFSDFDLSGVQGNHPEREYCVQYRETDFDFVSRLMEEEGIFYYFEHAENVHKLIMADSTSGYFDCKESSVDYPVHIAENRIVEAHIDSWEHVYEFRSGGFAFTDYNFKNPKSPMMVSERTLMKYENVRNYEQYDYPGEYLEKSVGTPLARVRMEEIELENDVVRASSSCKSFTPGGSFKVAEHPSKSEEGKKFVIKSVMHHATGPSYASGDSPESLEYSNQFLCFPNAATFRPARITPKPIVQGCQTAVVTGPSSEEIYVDEFGRVKVQFHWDRESPPPDQTSCWMRVSQVHAGKSFGGIDIPRIGEEVIVSFLEGDPDQPLITGRVYHKDNMPPYGLPDSKNISGMKSNSTKGGGGYNEFIMDDTKSKELIRIHAQYDMDTTIEHDDRQKVKNNRTITVDGTHTETIKKDTTITVTEGNLTEAVKKGFQQTTVKQQIEITSEAAHIYETAKTEIKLEVGKSKLLMKSDGSIEISGLNIAIKGKQSVSISGAEITSEAKMNNITKGAQVLSQGTATNIIKGGMVMLN